MANDPKTQFEEDLLGLSKEQFDQASALLEKVRNTRNGGDAETRRALAAMTDNEFERYKKSLGV
jgi:hypothetical protein